MTDLAVVDGGSGAAAPRRHRLFGIIAKIFAAETERHILWLPVFFATGIAIYFALTVEPPLWIGLAVSGTALAAALLLRHRRGARGFVIILLFGAAGFATVQI